MNVDSIDSSSSSSTSQFTHPTSSSSTKTLSILDGGIQKSLKRKRKHSSLHDPHLPSGYPTPSPPELFGPVVKIEVQDQRQERDSIQKRKQEPLSTQELLTHSFHFLPLHHDASATPLPQPSSAFPVETSYSKPISVTETPGQSSYQSKEQGTQTGLELPVSQEYLDWTGRGRSPFKTPALAAIDGLKKGAKVIEWLEREAVKERSELEKLIQWKIHLVTGLKRTQLEIEQDKMNPLEKVHVLPLPQDVDSYKGESQSPDKYISKMRHCTPPVYYQTIQECGHTLPERMADLLDLLDVNLGEGCIPSKYEAEIKAKQPIELRNVPRSAFSAMETRSELGIEQLWQKAEELVKETSRCIKNSSNHDAWSTRVVQKALEWEPSSYPTFSKAENIQSQPLAKSCRQTYKGQQFESKKTDWALIFSPDHPDVERQYDALTSQDLSQMNNNETSKYIMYSATEIKTPTGSPSEAKAQLFTWFQTGVTRLRKLLKKVGNGIPTADSTQPLLGWTAIGQLWDVYMAVGNGNQETDPIIIIGPFASCHCDTTTYFGVFNLLQLIERIKKWARERYWPWYCQVVVEPLKLVQDLPTTQEESAAEAMDVAEREELEPDRLS